LLLCDVKHPISRTSPCRHHCIRVVARYGSLHLHNMYDGSAQFAALHCTPCALLL
jgi:hypothetical protein